ncbi:hypothetical protein E2C01_028364 [Portunus trituberculatus]|uniref:Uncharacterized protein n=1 Tax=Portunus trituberculatus TaxID=210409 RepID=A0A5B7EP51_PORTR|nr:hypothetical protein [Portunus trituberculatus]
MKTKEEKDLGVIIQDNLNHKKHIEMVEKGGSEVWEEASKQTEGEKPCVTEERGEAKIQDPAFSKLYDNATRS